MYYSVKKVSKKVSKQMLKKRKKALYNICLLAIQLFATIYLKFEYKFYIIVKNIYQSFCQLK
jgi:hypothetical protein